MKTKLINAEFCVVLNLIGTFFLLMTYQDGSFYFWSMLVVLDLSSLLLLDETYLYKNRKMLWKEPEARRLKVYLVGLVLAYGLLAYRDLSLFILLLSNHVIILSFDSIFDLSKKRRK